MRTYLLSKSALTASPVAFIPRLKQLHIAHEAEAASRAAALAALKAATTVADMAGLIQALFAQSGRNFK